MIVMIVMIVTVVTVVPPMLEFLTIDLQEFHDLKPKAMTEPP